MKKTIFSLLILVIVLVGIWLYFKKTNNLSTEGISTELSSVNYSCSSGKTIRAAFYDGETKSAAAAGEPPIPGGSVKIKLSDGRIMTLLQTISASGIRYANKDESFVFWSKGNSALVLEDGVEKNYIGCIAVSPEQSGENLSQIYSNSKLGFTLRLPNMVASTSAGYADSYKVDESYRYQLNPNRVISGVKFTIPNKTAEGTNLSKDSYIAVEWMPNVTECSAAIFLDGTHKNIDISENGVSYSVASSSNAGAGNRYDEIIYAVKNTNPCIAMRYFIHHTVVQNYPPGTIREFDRSALLREFDSIRKSLVLAQ